jgi:23S rRNA pseudouridine2605 synthase
LERLQKVLAHAGVASRRKCEELIEQGRVKVNGEVITNLGTKVDTNQDKIEVDQQLIQAERLTYYIFHKPTGYITSVTDPHGRKVVMEFFQNIEARIYPVGRLDRDTSGLLILTNDGELAHKLMHPSFLIDKVYLATVQGVPTEGQLNQLRQGIKLNDGMTSPAEVELIQQGLNKRNQSESVLRMTIHEGRNRQVRRMCQAIGHRVVKLHREKYGFLTLKGLHKGEYRELTADEVKQIKILSSHNFHN